MRFVQTIFVFGRPRTLRFNPCKHVLPRDIASARRWLEALPEKVQKKLLKRLKTSVLDAIFINMKETYGLECNPCSLNNHTIECGCSFDDDFYITPKTHYFTDLRVFYAALVALWRVHGSPRVRRPQTPSFYLEDWAFYTSLLSTSCKFWDFCE